MSMSNWSVNMRGTARIRYFYWKQPVNTPVPPTPVPTSTMPPLTLDDFGIFLEDTWSPDERAEILRAAWETGRALSAHGAAATPVEAFREVLQGVNDRGIQRILRFNRIDNDLPVCITSKTEDNPDYSASIGCDPSVIMNQYTAVHEFGHVLVGRTTVAGESSFLSKVENPNGNILTDFSPTPTFVMGPRGYNLVRGQSQDWQRSNVVSDNGWGSAGLWDQTSIATYQFPTTTPGTQPAPLVVPQIGPCGPGAPPLPVAAGTPFPFQQNPCTFADWEEVDDVGTITEIEEAAADMFLNWVYWKNYGDSVSFRNYRWRSSTCYPDGCPDTGQSGQARSNWMNQTMAELFIEFNW
jgi:hypothetical protein